MTLPSSAARPFFGWHVVAATFLLAIFGWGVGFYGPPVFLYAVVARTGWPVAMASAAVTVHFLFGAVVVANLPGLYRRWGVPVVTVTRGSHGHDLWLRRQSVGPLVLLQARQVRSERVE